MNHDERLLSLGSEYVESTKVNILLKITFVKNKSTIIVKYFVTVKKFKNGSVHRGLKGRLLMACPRYPIVITYRWSADRYDA